MHEDGYIIGKLVRSILYGSIRVEQRGVCGTVSHAQNSGAYAEPFRMCRTVSCMHFRVYRIVPCMHNATVHARLVDTQRSAYVSHTLTQNGSHTQTRSSKLLK